MPVIDNKTGIRILNESIALFYSSNFQSLSQESERLLDACTQHV